MKIIKRPNGIFLVTGPTGSGKSTTLVAALHQVIDPSVNVLTCASTTVERMFMSSARGRSPNTESGKISHGLARNCSSASALTLIL